MIGSLYMFLPFFQYNQMVDEPPPGLIIYARGIGTFHQILRVNG